MKLSKSWRDEFASGDLQRGEEYFVDGCVRSLSVANGGWGALVEGYYHDYDVFVPGDSESMESMSCSCPRFEDGYPCKHIVATCLAIESRQLDAAGGDQGSLTRLERLVQATDEADLRKFLLEVLTVDDGLAKVFVQRFGDVDVAEARRMLADQIADAVHKCSRGGFIDWRAAAQFESAWHRIVGSSLDALIERRALDVALEVSIEALESIQDLDIDDSDGFTGDAIEDIREYWKRILELGDEDYALRMHDRICTFVDSEGYDEYGVFDIEIEMAEDFLVDAFADMPRFASPIKRMAIEQMNLARNSRDRAQEELRQLREQMDVSTAPVEGLDYKSPLYKLNNDARMAVTRIRSQVKVLGNWALVLMRAMKAEGASKSQLWDAAKEAVADENVCMCFVRPALEEGDEQTALEVLLECKRACQNLGDGQYTAKVSQQLANLLADKDVLGMREELLYQMRLQDRRTTFEGHLPVDVLWKRLRESYGADEWADVRMGILDSMGDGAALRACLAAEGLYGMLMDEVEATGLFALDKYEAELAKRYPERVLAMHLKEIEGNQTYPGHNRKAYQLFCQRLVHIKGLPGGEIEVHRIVEQIRCEYPRRPALLDELSRV